LRYYPYTDYGTREQVLRQAEKKYGPRSTWPLKLRAEVEEHANYLMAELAKLEGVPVTINARGDVRFKQTL
jgi:hypothetical protein